MFVHFSFILIVLRFFVISSFFLVFASIFRPSVFFHCFFDDFSGVDTQNLTLVLLDFNQYSNSLVKRGRSILSLVAIPFLVGALFFSFINSITVTEFFLFSFSFTCIFVGFFFGFIIWFLDLRFIPGLFTAVNPPFFSSRIRLDTNIRDFPSLLAILVGDIRDAVFFFFIFFCFLTASFFYPNLFCFKTPFSRWSVRFLFITCFIYIVGGEGFYYDTFRIGVFLLFFELFVIVRHFLHFLHRKILFYPFIR